MPTQVTNYQCPACTGPLHFVGASGKLECDYCGSTYDVAEIEALYAEKEAKAAETQQKEEQKQAAKKQEAADNGWDTSDMSDDWGDDADAMRAYSCPSCGAELICDETTAATSCPYCGNPTVVPGKFAGALKPEYVLPFKLAKEDAVKALKAHYKGKPFLPKAFSAENHVQEIKGVYVPFWMFDGEAEGWANYKASRSHTHREGDYEVTRTEHFDVYREGSLAFEKIPVDASSKMPDDHMDSIEPFDYKELKPFSTAYLPGFLADKYDVSVEDSQERADSRCAGTAGADIVGAEELAAKIQNEGFMDFDVVIATPDMMGVVGRLGKVLGPRGLMPNPKAGTVTPDVAKAITEAKAGKIEYRLDKTNIIHCPIGKVSFGKEKLQENFDTLMGAIVKARPAAAKGQYVKSCVIATTMGPGIRISPAKYN